MQHPFTLLKRLEALEKGEDCKLIRDLIAGNGYFRFNDADFVGRPAVPLR